MDTENQKFQWEPMFEENFSISKLGKPSYWRIIIGQEPYKRQIGSIPLKSNSPASYNGMEVAFLVNKWIKMTDSLEMILQLLCYTPYNGNGIPDSKPFEVFSYLRKNDISSEEFADYLKRRHQLILINKSDIENKNSNNYLHNLLGNGKQHYVLFVGAKSKKYFNDLLFRNCIKGSILHPSGTNLNFNNQEYYESWYQLLLSPRLNSNTLFSLQNFKIF